MTSKTQNIWRRTTSGILVPDGAITDLSEKSRSTYLEVKLKVEQMEEVYSRNSILIPNHSDLACLIKNANLFFEKWFGNKNDELTMMMLFKVLYLNRIALAIIQLKDEPLRKKYFEALLSSSLDFIKRKKSTAKDIFWELEVWSFLRKNAIDLVHLHEPPDVVIEFDQSKLGIACKKLYSEKHVQNVLSEAIQQIENSFEFGIVALNLDDLIPEDKFLKANSYEEIFRILQELNTQFIERHDRHLRKYLSSDRLICAIISTTAPAITDILNFVSQKIIWTIPGLEYTKSQQLRKFKNLFFE
jgi:hypothetical protein